MLLASCLLCQHDARNLSLLQPVANDLQTARIIVDYKNHFLSLYLPSEVSTRSRRELTAAHKMGIIWGSPNPYFSSFSCLWILYRVLYIFVFDNFLCDKAVFLLLWVGFIFEINWLWVFHEIQNLFFIHWLDILFQQLVRKEIILVSTWNQLSAVQQENIISQSTSRSYTNIVQILIRPIITLVFGLTSKQTVGAGYFGSRLGTVDKVQGNVDCTELYYWWTDDKIWCSVVLLKYQILTLIDGSAHTAAVALAFALACLVHECIRIPNTATHTATKLHSRSKLT